MQNFINFFNYSSKKWLQNQLNLLTVIAATAIILVACSKDNPVTEEPLDPTAPYIQEIERENPPLEMNRGYEIVGLRFGTTKGKLILADSVEADIVRWRDTLIAFSTNYNLAPGEMYVISADGKKSNKFKYTVAPYNDYPTMIHLPGGTFKMGNNNSAELSEKPEHTVTVKPFYISEIEITQQQYLSVMTTTPNFTPVSDEHPANYVNMIDIVRFCNRLSRSQGLDSCYTIENPHEIELVMRITCDFSKNGFRLPTDAEWEYAARAGSTNLSPSPLNEYAWFGNEGTSATPSKCRQKKANAFGLYDMNGNVEEWVWDIYSPTYYNESNNSNNPTGPATGEMRIVRGGSYRDEENLVRNTSKKAVYQVDRQRYRGFRVVR